MKRHSVWASLAPVLLVITSLGHAETGAEGWLRYAPLTNSAAARYAALPSQIVVPGNNPIDQAEKGSITRGGGVG